MSAQPGIIDPSFGTSGIVSTTFPEGASSGTAIATQADGKIVVAGVVIVSGGVDIALARYLGDGTLDSTFGVGGMVVTDLGESAGAYAVAVQTDGKIIVVGQRYSSGVADVMVARYEADGSLDATFGSGGVVTTELGGDYDFAVSIAVQGDDKIVVAGAGGPGATTDLAVVRYETDGTLDAAFGTGGIVLTDFGSGTETDGAQALALQADGKIVATGYAVSSGVETVAIARYDTTGALDATFGTGGKRTVDFGPAQDFGTGIAIRADGRMVVSAFDNGSGYFALLGLESNGDVDSGFGVLGKVTTSLSGVTADVARAVRIEANGRIVVAGAKSESSSAAELALVGYQPDGTLDPDFGSGGITTTDFPGSSGATGRAMAVQPDGKLLVAGGVYYGSPQSFALARYFGGNAPPVCGPAPEPDGSCRLAAAGSSGGSLVSIKNETTDTKDQFKWKWGKGVATMLGDFKAPDTGFARYRVCVYDGSGGVQPLREATVYSGGAVVTCGTKPCWKSSTTGFSYKSKAGVPDGITGLKLKVGDAGKAQIQVKAKGPLVAPPAPGALVADVVVQLLIDDGSTVECFKTSFPGSGGSVLLQTGNQFKATGP